MSDDLRPADLGRVHLIGVGGAGMSAIAVLLAARGLDGQRLRRRRRSGPAGAAGGRRPGARGSRRVARRRGGHGGRLVGGPPDQPRARPRARSDGLRVLHRSEALAALMVDRDAVAVAGAHGKTTTSAMIATALLARGRSTRRSRSAARCSPPTGRWGVAATARGPAFVAEADESDGSFLAYAPLVAVVTNVEPDHLDHYGSRRGVRGRVRRLRRPHPARRAAGRVRRRRRRGPAGRARPRGLAERGVDGGDLRHVARRGRRGRASCTPTATGGPSRSTRTTSTPLVRLALPGAHNALNAAAAWTAARRLGVGRRRRRARRVPRHRPPVRAPRHGRRCAGRRRLRAPPHRGRRAAARLRGRSRGTVGCVVLFQPHLYSRTRTFADEFGAAFDLADVVVVTDVYAAREDPDPSVTGALIVDRVPTPGRRPSSPTGSTPRARSPRRPGRATCCSPSAPAT